MKHKVLIPVLFVLGFLAINFESEAQSLSGNPISIQNYRVIIPFQYGPYANGWATITKVEATCYGSVGTVPILDNNIQYVIVSVPPTNTANFKVYFSDGTSTEWSQFITIN